MPVIALQGIRGGTGVTSVAAGLAWALQHLKESVLLIDLSADNLLRLHFGMSFEQAQGWARSHQDRQPWQDSIFSYNELVSVLPFGKITQVERINLEDDIQNESDFWKKNIEMIFADRGHRWVLIDLPADNTLLTQQGLERADTIFILLNPDMNSHVRLHQQKIPEGSYFLMNQYSSTKPLQKDLSVLWQQLLTNFLPIVLHSDEAAAEAFAIKKPIGEYSLQSLVAKDIAELASWCLNHSSGNGK